MFLKSCRVLFLPWALLLFFACEKEEIHQGTAGNYYAINVEAQFGVDDPSFGWDILESPRKSLLSYTDLYLRKNGREMAFEADAPGAYLFELIIFDGAGEAVNSQKYRFEIAKVDVILSSESPSVMIEEETSQPEVEEAVLTDEIAGETSAGNEEVEMTENVEIGREEIIKTGDVEIEEEAVAVAELPASPVPPPPPAPYPRALVAPNVFAAPPPPSGEEAPVRSIDTPPAPLRIDKISKIEGRVTIQVASWPTLEEAEKQMIELQNIGFDAYVQKAYFEETDEVWYRVRIGAFNSVAEAQEAVTVLKTVTGYAAWVDHVRADQ